ncbi:TPA: DUF371 domain-containing protein [Candidatus Woesearchaeota archaeon]|nr:hypothetical protein QT06_C0001G0499 [archaeon GW2011_AR15]MBS3103810.1 DUF371 domain-containing protein [Candidatus Woesearchaeota archaeon]HIH41900.1 DUF371 domain-containing protein [Candidatus Woesearchaeota archaeon]
MIFSISGHENLLGTHRNTLEFTRHGHLTRKGDCIVGVSADYSVDELKKLAKKYSRMKITITAGGLKDTVTAALNKDFSHPDEIVVRKTDFISARTLGIKADKAAIGLNRGIIEMLKNPGARASVEIAGIE